MKPEGALRLVHAKEKTRLGWATVEAHATGDARALRVTVSGRTALEAEGLALAGRAPLALGKNALRLEAQRADDRRWITLAELALERDARFEPAPPERVVDRLGRELLLDEVTEEYRAHDGSTLVYVPVSSGKFDIGSTECKYTVSFGGERPDELTQVSEPVHGVRLTRPFLLGKHEVSWRQLAAWVDATRPEDPPLAPRALAGRPPRGRAHLAPGQGLLRLGRPGAADRDAVGVGRARSRRVALPVGGRRPRRRQARSLPQPPARRPWGPLPVDDATLLDVSWVGALHLAGNVSEWAEDLFMPTYAARVEYDVRVDPVWRRDPGEVPPTPTASRGAAAGRTTTP